MTNSTHSRFNSGFTLVELLVATLLISVVMGGVYVSFSTQIRLWRRGEANVRTYQDARTALSIMTRELQNHVSGAGHLFQGDSNEFEFFAVTQPMDVDDGEERRPLWIRYRTKADPDSEGKILLREERVVNSPLPTAPPREGEIDRTVIKLGAKHDFELAAAVKKFEMEYYWIPPQEKRDALGNDEPPAPTNYVVRDEHPEKTGIPQAIKLTLTLYDENAESGETTFTSFAVFRGETTELEDETLETRKSRFL